MSSCAPAFLASVFVSLDTMLFVHSSAGVLDVSSLLFAVSAVLVYSKGRFYVSAILFGIAVSHKLPTVLLLFAYRGVLE